MHRHLQTVTALTAAAGIGLTGLLVATGAPPAAGSDERGWRHVAWSVAGPPLAIGAPSCDPTGHCAYPFTDSGTDAGDLQGSHAAAGGAAVDATGHTIATTRTSVFTGSVRGCGTGTAVLAIQAVTHADGTTSEGWHVRTGFGSGGLGELSGFGTGDLAAGSTTAHFSGWLRCHR